MVKVAEHIQCQQEHVLMLYQCTYIPHVQGLLLATPTQLGKIGMAFDFGHSHCSSAKPQIAC